MKISTFTPRLGGLVTVGSWVQTPSVNGGIALPTANFVLGPGAFFKLSFDMVLVCLVKAWASLAQGNTHTQENIQKQKLRDLCRLRPSTSVLLAIYVSMKSSASRSRSASNEGARKMRRKNPSGRQVNQRNTKFLVPGCYPRLSVCLIEATASSAIK